MEGADERLTSRIMTSVSLVSVIVPVYNPGPHLRDALASIVVQRHRPIEIVVVDDGSTENVEARVGAALAGLATADDRLWVRVIRRENGGPAAARNTGIAAARGTFIAFLDQDDCWQHDKLATQVSRLTARPDVDVSVGHLESWWDGRPGAASLARQPDQPRAGVVPGYLASVMLARRDVFARVGGFNPDYRYGDSLDWFARATELGVCTELLPDVLLFHRVHETNLSRHGDASRAECARILKRALDRRRRASAAPA